MQIITFGKRLVPADQIALVEPFDPGSNPEFKPEKTYLSRVVLLMLDLAKHIVNQKAGHFEPDKFEDQHNVRPRIAIEANSADSIIAIVRGAPIATVMPSATARQLPGLKAVPILPSVGTWTLSVLQRKDAYRSAASKALVTILKQRKSDARL